jgi:hypothetical protein
MMTSSWDQDPLKFCKHLRFFKLFNPNHALHLTVSRPNSLPIQEKKLDGAGPTLGNKFGQQLLNLGPTREKKLSPKEQKNAWIPRLNN